MIGLSTDVIVNWT